MRPASGRSPLSHTGPVSVGKAKKEPTEKKDTAATAVPVEELEGQERASPSVKNASPKKRKEETAAESTEGAAAEALPPKSKKARAAPKPKRNEHVSEVKLPKPAPKLYRAANITRIATENMHTPPVELVGLLTAEWEALDGIGKTSYLLQEAADVARYEEELAAEKARWAAEDAPALPAARGDKEAEKGAGKAAGKEAKAAQKAEAKEAKKAEKAAANEAKQKKTALPTKPRSGYMLFGMEVRGPIVEANPELKSKVTEISKLIGAQWKQLNEEGRQVWEARVEEDKARFVSECEAACIDPTEVIPSWGKAAERAAKAAAAPKEVEREPTKVEAEVLDAIEELKKGGVSGLRTLHGWEVRVKARTAKEAKIAKSKEETEVEGVANEAEAARLVPVDLTVTAPKRVSKKKLTSLLAVKRAMGVLSLAPERVAAPKEAAAEEAAREVADEAPVAEEEKTATTVAAQEETETEEAKVGEALAEERAAR